MNIQGDSKIRLKILGTDSSLQNNKGGVHTHIFANADQFHCLHVLPVSILYIFVRDLHKTISLYYMSPSGMSVV